MKELILVTTLKIGVFIVIILLFWIGGSRVGTYFKDKYTHQDEELGYAPTILYDGIVTGVVLFGVFIACVIIGLDLGFLLFGLSFGIAYACKNTIRNMLSGIMILTNKEFKMGDLIEFIYDSHQIYFGRIEEITLRYSLLRKLDKTRVIIPNYLLTSLPIITYSSEKTVRLETAICIVHGSDIEYVKQLLLHAIHGLDFVIEKDFTLITLQNIGVRGMEFVIYFYIDPKAGRLRFRAISDIDKAIAKSLKKAKISFAYPHTVCTIDTKDEYIKKSFDVVGTNIN